jgi:UPF0042 nucleotide-binding protein
MTRLVVVSGLSGSGKSVALNMLEDLGWYCIDNIPAGLVQALVSHSLRTEEPLYRRLAVGLDARNRPDDLASIPAVLADLRRAGLRCEVLYLHAEDEVLLRRYAETRRRHPLAGAGVSLADAIAEERRLLHPLIDSADLVIDTSRMSVHELRDMIAKRVEPQAPGRLSILFESFGFKHGTPGDADFVFDARTLPNPYWEPALKSLTGRDPAVIEFLEASPRVEGMVADLIRFIESRLPEYEETNRGYLTIAIGAPGGQHRSVYRRAARPAFPPEISATPRASQRAAAVTETAPARDDRGARFAAIQEALAGSLRGADRMVAALHPAEVALLLESLPPRPRLLAWELVETGTQGDVLVELSEEVRSELLVGMLPDELGAASEGLATDDLADLLAELPEAVMRQVLRSMDQQTANGCARARGRIPRAA